MNIFLVSECSKNALKETRRIIDQFAERTGQRAWQTPITQKGLETLQGLLRKTARKTQPLLAFGHEEKTKQNSFGLWVIALNLMSAGAYPPIELNAILYE